MTNKEAFELIERYEKLGRLGSRSILEKIPKEELVYKCHTCHNIVDKNPCPVCGEVHLSIMCPLDHCSCNHDVMSGIVYCPICGEPICPECGCHDVSTISRVTGYLQETSGWNAGKQQELKDRTRYNIK